MSPLNIELGMCIIGIPFWLGGILQIRKMIKTKSSKDVNTLTWGLFLLSQIIWLWYGIKIKSLSLVVTNFMCINTNLSVVLTIMYYSDDQIESILKRKNIFKILKK